MVPRSRESDPNSFGKIKIRSDRRIPPFRLKLLGRFYSSTSPLRIRFETQGHLRFRKPRISLVRANEDFNFIIRQSLQHLTCQWPIKGSLNRTTTINRDTLPLELLVDFSGELKRFGISPY